MERVTPEHRPPIPTAPRFAHVVTSLCELKIGKATGEPSRPNMDAACAFSTNFSNHYSLGTYLSRAQWCNRELW